MESSLQNHVAALDFGTSKICCVIGRVEDERIIIDGIGHRAASGIRAGVIIDMDAAEACVLAAISAAEQEAGIRLEQISAAVNAIGLRSWMAKVEVATGMRAVTEADLRRLLDRAETLDIETGTELLHTVPTGGYWLDDMRAIHDPRGLHGNMLGVGLHMIAAPSQIIRNLLICLERCRIDAELLMAAPFAAGLAVIDKDEAELGTVVLDLGAATTGISVFHKGSCVFVDILPIGGRHVTQDIAKGLSISINDAERLKTIYGLVWGSDDEAENDMLEITQIGEDNVAVSNERISRALLSGSSSPRIEEILEMACNRLDECGFASIAGMRVVLTGGVSLMLALRPLAETIFGGQARLARPRNLSGLAISPPGPDLSVAVGSLLHTARQRANIDRPLPSMRRGMVHWARSLFNKR